jgi:hypothetical protein
MHSAGLGEKERKSKNVLHAIRHGLEVLLRGTNPMKRAHCQKTGIATPKTELDLIKQRLKAAEADSKGTIQ